MSRYFAKLLLVLRDALQIQTFLAMLAVVMTVLHSAKRISVSWLAVCVMCAGVGVSGFTAIVSVGE